MIPIYAITTRGLENICAEEMDRIPGLTIHEIKYRRVTAHYNGSIELLTELRTVDDIFIDLSTWGNIPTQRAALEKILNLSQDLSLEQPLQEIRNFRALPNQPQFSVTCNFIGRRKYSSQEVKLAVAEGIHKQTGYTYNEDDRQSDLNIRVFIEHETAFVGIRLAKTALQKRSYKQHHISGSLKPPIAAAMISLLNQYTSQKIIDPFCGGGTLLIEASMMGKYAVGGDLSQTNLLSAIQNALEAGNKSEICQLDAVRLPFPNNSFNAVVSNFPWGRQVQTGTNLQALYNQTFMEIRRILKPNGQVVVLTNQPELIPKGGCDLWKKNILEISLFGQNPSIIVLENKNPNDKIRTK